MVSRVACAAIGLALSFGCSSSVSNGGPDGGGGGSQGGGGGLGGGGGQGGSASNPPADAGDGDGAVSDAPAPMSCSPGTAITWEHRTVCNWLNYVSPDAGTLSFPGRATSTTRW